MVDYNPYYGKFTESFGPLSSYVEIQTGAQFSKDDSTTVVKPGYVRVLRGGNIVSGEIITKPDDLYIPEKFIHDGMCLKKGDIVTPAVTSLENIGKIGFCRTDFGKCVVGGFVFYIRTKSDDVLPKWLYYLMQSTSFIACLRAIVKKSGSAFYNINKRLFETIEIAVPGKKYQRNVIDCVDNLLASLDTLSHAQNHYLELEALLRSKVLDLAIRGKLVPQDPDDEPASVLLERIKAERDRLAKEGKIKLPKTVSEEISEADKNYYRNYPITLALEAVCSYGTTVQPELASLSDPVFIALEDVEPGSKKYDMKPIVAEKFIRSQSNSTFTAEMILYSKLRPYLDKAIWPKRNGVTTSEFIPIFSYISPDYLLLFLHSASFLKRINLDAYGIKMPRVKKETFLKTIIPVWGDKTTAGALKIVEEVSALLS